MATDPKQKPKILAIIILEACRCAGKHLTEGHGFIVGKDISSDDATELVKIGRAKACDPKVVARINKKAATRDKLIADARKQVEEKRTALHVAQVGLRAATSEADIKVARVDVDSALSAFEEAEGKLHEAVSMGVGIDDESDASE